MQMVRSIGSATPPVSTKAVIEALAPTLTEATAKAPMPFPPRCARPRHSFGVAASAIMSGTGVGDAKSRSVFTPTMLPAAAVLAQAKLELYLRRVDRLLGRERDDEGLKQPRLDVCRRIGLPGQGIVLGSVV